MQITFLQTRMLSEDGHTVQRFEAGVTCDVADLAARYAIRQGWASEQKEAA